MDLHIYIHTVPDASEGAKLDKITNMLSALVQGLGRIEQQEIIVMADLKSLSAQVKANTDVEASAVVLIQGIAAQLEAAKNDPVALQALSDSLKSSADALAAAVTANTPAA